MGIPKQIGPYVVKRQLSSGGFAHLYEATLENSPCVRIVVKVSRTSRAAPEAQEYFADALNQEADILKQLDHPSIVRIYPIPERTTHYVARAVTLPGQPEYFAIEYLSGGSLKQFVKEQEQLPLKLAAEIVYQVASALEYIHLREIVHRDLKPENVLFRYMPSEEIVEAVLIDFGAASGQNVLGDRSMTPIVAAPERIRQVRGEVPPEEVVDQCKTDVYGLGILLYNMLTGRFPFEGITENSVTTAILREAPAPPTKYNPDIPPKLEELILSCLEKKPANRLGVRKFIEEMNREVPSPRKMQTKERECSVEERVDILGKPLYERMVGMSGLRAWMFGLLALLLIIESTVICGLTGKMLIDHIESPAASEVISVPKSSPTVISTPLRESPSPLLPPTSVPTRRPTPTLISTTSPNG